jgi:hypothetical protein
LSQILSRQSTAGLLVGDVTAAELYGEEGRALAEAIGDRFNSRQCRLSIAWAHMSRGDTATAVRLYADLIPEASDAQDLMSVVSGPIPQAFALAYHGDAVGARAAAAAALEACTELGFLLANACGRGDGELAGGDAAAALEAAERPCKVTPTWR